MCVGVRGEGEAGKKTDRGWDDDMRGTPRPLKTKPNEEGWNYVHDDGGHKVGYIEHYGIWTEEIISTYGEHHVDEDKLFFGAFLCQPMEES